MEQIGKIALVKEPLVPKESQITQTSSANIPQRQNLGISREKVTAMLDVLKARWQTRGWHAMAKEDSEPMALEFIRALDRHEIPWQHYRELYNRSLDLRSRRMSQGMPCDDFSADLMVACWPNLKTDLREREIAAGRTLTAQAQSLCTDCFGTGTKIIKDQNGRTIGVGSTCEHEHIVTEERISDFTQVEEVLNRPVPEETAVDICKRIRQSLAYAYVHAANQAESDKAWLASRTWAHAERYCRETPEQAISKERC